MCSALCVILNIILQASGISFKTKPDWIEQEMWKFGYCSLEAAQSTERSRLRLKVRHHTYASRLSHIKRATSTTECYRFAATAMTS
jgi:hypothetical protein